MLDVCVPALTGLIADQLQARKPERLGNRHRNACPSDVYPAADGEILIFCLTEPHWRTLARLWILVARFNSFQALIRTPLLNS